MTKKQYRNTYQKGYDTGYREGISSIAREDADEYWVSAAKDLIKQYRIPYRLVVKISCKVPSYFVEKKYLSKKKVSWAVSQSVDYPFQAFCYLDGITEGRE